MSTIFNFRISNELLDYVEEQSTVQGISNSDFVRKLIEQDMKQTDGDSATEQKKLLMDMVATSYFINTKFARKNLSDEEVLEVQNKVKAINGNK